MSLSRRARPIVRTCLVYDYNYVFSESQAFWKRTSVYTYIK